MAGGIREAGPEAGAAVWHKPLGVDVSGNSGKTNRLDVE